MNTSFFQLNIIHPHWGSHTASHWLDERRAAVVFYGDYTIAELLAGANLPGRPLIQARALRQAQLFLNFQQMCAEQNIEPIIVTIHNSTIWIYTPTGSPYDDRDLIQAPARPHQDLPKVIPVKILAKVPSSSAPIVLAAMRASRAFNSGTFVEIDPVKYRANINAIQFLLGRPLEPRIQHPLGAIGPLEYETLVAKIFEELGCFVPAHRGGAGEDVDLFIHPEGCAPVAGLHFPAGAPLSLQLKLRESGNQADLVRWLRDAPSQDRYLLVNDWLTAKTVARFQAAGVVARVLDRRWLIDTLKFAPSTARWLHRSTRWAFPDDGSQDGAYTGSREI